MRRVKPMGAPCRLPDAGGGAAARVEGHGDEQGGEGALHRPRFDAIGDAVGNLVDAIKGLFD